MLRIGQLVFEMVQTEMLKMFPEVSLDMMFMILAHLQILKINLEDLPPLQKIVLVVLRLELRILINRTEASITDQQRNVIIRLLDQDQILLEIILQELKEVRQKREIILVPQEAEVIHQEIMDGIAQEATLLEIIVVPEAVAILREATVAGTVLRVVAVDLQLDLKAEVEALLQNLNLVAQKEDQDNLINI